MNRIVALALFVCGVWLLWSATHLVDDSHHRGSALQLIERDRDVAKEGKSDRFSLDQAISEGKHGYSLLSEAITTLVVGGMVAIITSALLIVGQRKVPNQSSEPALSSGTPPAGQESRPR